MVDVSALSFLLHALALTLLVEWLDRHPVHINLVSFIQKGSVVEQMEEETKEVHLENVH